MSDALDGGRPVAERHRGLTRRDRHLLWLNCRRLALTVGISPYLRRLRERVDHDLVLLPSVAVLPWDDDGRMLLVQEAETGLWQTIGGAVKLGG
jgi:hypothetical protein